MPFRPVLPVEVAARFPETGAGVELPGAVVCRSHQEPIAADAVKGALGKQLLQYTSGEAAAACILTGGHAVDASGCCSTARKGEPSDGGGNAVVGPHQRVYRRAAG